MKRILFFLLLLLAVSLQQAQVKYDLQLGDLTFRVVTADDGTKSAEVFTFIILVGMFNQLKKILSYLPPLKSVATLFPLLGLSEEPLPTCLFVPFRYLIL